VYWKTLPEPEASLVAGVVLGEQTQLPEAFKTALSKTGTSHIVVASGFNVVVMAGLAAIVLRSFSKRWRILGGMGLVLGYVWLTGASPPVARAGLMAGVMLLGSLVGREYWSGWTLVGVGLVMLVIQPWLINSVSFQLSLAATAGVIWGSHLPIGRAKDQSTSVWKQVWFGLVGLWVTTLAATLMTAPILFMTFGQVAWWGLIVNPLVLWLIAPLMYLGLLLALSGTLWWPLAEGLRFVVWPVASSVVGIIELMGRVPVEPITGTINGWIVVGWWCLCLGGWGWWRNRRTTV
jgi:competence protein ComEC